MQETIRFTANGADPAQAASRQRATAAAIRRFVPYVVAWGCARPGAAVSLVLPETLSAHEVVQRAAGERLELTTVNDPAAPDRVIELHYAHLAEAEIEEGMRRLGHCLVRYLTLAAGSASPELGFVGP